MALPIFQRTVVDNSGNIQPNAQISVFSEATGLPVEVFADRDGQSPLGSTFFVGSDALARFYAPPGEYRVQADGTSGQINWRFVQLIDTQDITTIASNFAAVEAVNDNLQAIIDAPQAALDAAAARDDAQAARDAAEGFKDDAEAAAAQLDPTIFPWLGTAIGETKHIVIDDTDLYPPDDSALFRYILLTAGEDGAGGYNEGLLINEDIDANYVDGNGHSGLRVTAEINMPSSPLHGVVIDLINSSGAFIRPGETAGVFEHDQMQRIEGSVIGSTGRGFSSPSPQGALIVGASTNGRLDSVSSGTGNFIDFNSASSPDARASATTAGQTQPTNLSGVFLLRVA